MKNNLTRHIYGFLSTLLVSLLVSNGVYAQSGQFKLIDKTFTWDENTGGSGCFGYHFWTDMGESTTSNWKSPFDFQNGTFYFRYEIISQPELSGGGYQPFQLSFCIWSDYGFEPGKWKETCSRRSESFNGPGSVVSFSESPSVWWAKEWGNIDWTNMSKLWRFGNPFWYNSTYLLASPGCTNAPAEIWENEKTKFFPMQLRITIVAVAQGQSFLGWDHYLNGGTVVRKPTPNFAIDFANERTNKPVPSTIEYANNASMTSAVSGNGTAITLTPGSTVYFRAKAGGDTLASEVQILNVPSRPAAPTFVWNQATAKTLTAVSNEFEYSTTATMSGAVSGSGTNVSITPGTYMYFRKKATSTAFKSSVQVLYGVELVSIGPEFVILNEIIEYPNTTDDDGFYFFYHNESMPVNWLTPYDYYNGQIYTRYEIISQPTTTPIGLQFGIWQRLPVGSTNDANLFESMAPVVTLNGPGNVATLNSCPSTYWTYHGGVDYSQMNNIWHFGINPWKLSPNTQIRQENAEVWNQRFTYWFPLKVRVTVVAVASGYSFSGWQNYVGTGTAPNYQIDYSAECTSTNVSTTDEYSTNLTSWTAGANTKINLVPGQKIYFRRIAFPTYQQELNIPIRPAAPSFTIDYQHERTVENISPAYQYSQNSNMSGSSPGSGQPVTLVPGSVVYFRSAATDAAFSSNIQTMNVPSRPAGPIFSINYVTERTAENISADVEYSVTSDFSSKVSGTGTTLAISPGSTFYFRKVASGSSFQSLVTELNAPARPAPPAFGINYAYERTTTAVGNDYEYSFNPDMSSSVAGANVALLLTPGTDVYFRKKPTSSSFISGIQHLIVPNRPAAPAFTINYVNEKTAENIPASVHYASNATFSAPHEGTGIPVNLVPGTDIYLRYKSADAAFTSETQVLDVPERPIVTCQAANPTDDSPILFDIQFPNMVNGFEANDLQLSNCNFSSLSGSYIVGVTPTINGLVSVAVKANSVTPANFASLPSSVTFSGISSVDGTKSTSLRIVPTLTSSFITVLGDNIEGYEYKIVNIDGNTLISGILEQSGFKINVEKLMPGVYHLVINRNGAYKTLRFVRTSE